MIAVVLFMAVHITVHLWLPGHDGGGAGALADPGARGVLLVALVTVDPMGVAEARRRRQGALVIVGLLVLAALYGTGVLIRDLIQGTGVANEAGHLLAAALVVWSGNNLSFALLYWLHRRRRPDSPARPAATTPPTSRSPSR